MARIISGNRTAEDIVRMHLQKLQEEAQKPKGRTAGTQPPLPPAVNQPPIPAATVNQHSLIFQNITCVGADNQPFEHYDALSVITDVVRENGTYSNSTVQKHKSFTPYQAISFFEQQRNGLFSPSFALSCNVLVASYLNKNRPACEALLQQYKDYGSGYGWHAQNTVINWGARQIIHYPRDSDFPAHGGTSNINQSQPQKKLPFDRTSFADMTLEEALKRPNFLGYIKNLTGLANPADLIEIGNYFGKTARVWVSSSNETRAAWFGCNSDGLDLSGGNYLDSNGAARGVRLVAP